MTKQRNEQRGHGARLMTMIVLVLAMGGGLASYAARDRTKSRTAVPDAVAMDGAPSALAPGEPGWTVGELRDDGLRIIPSGRADASAVLDPGQFSGEVRRAYWVATRIPGVLNQLYCWCACENRGEHRSNLACFEDLMDVDCDVCRDTAEIAYEMHQQGITDAGAIQARVDAKWAPARTPS